MAGIKETFSKGFTTLNVKTNNFVEETKIKTYITTLENEIAELEKKIGAALFTQWKSDAVDVEALKPDLQAIDTKRAEIENQKQKIAAMQAEAQQILGAKETPPAQPAGEGIFCSKCGTKNLLGNKFCTKCGNPLQ